jgi:hypothetical protein
MLKKLHANNRIQLVIGLVVGVLFGFLLQKGGVTDYDVILNQLLLTDFTVLKIMLSASITGMLGVHLLKSLGLVQLIPKSGSVGKSILGGLIFGVAFAILGYCPGTVAAAVGQGSLDAAISGVVGILIGSWLLAAIYPKIEKPVLRKGDFGTITIPELLKVNDWVVVIPAALLLAGFLFWLETIGL